MKNKVKSVCVFCGSKFGINPKFRGAALELGGLIGQRQLRLIYGGGNVGLMGVIADSCLQVGGQVIGVIPKSLLVQEVAHDRLTELRVVDSMHERKALMEQLSNIVIAMPGGFGTLDELNEILTWKQLGFHRMPIYLLNIAGYFDEFLKFLKKAAQEGFISQEHLNFVIVCNSVDELNHRWSADGLQDKGPVLGFN